MPRIPRNNTIRWPRVRIPTPLLDLGFAFLLVFTGFWVVEWFYMSVDWLLVVMQGG